VNHVCACDDGQKYYLLANGHAWVWDYQMSTYSNPSWFYLEGIPGISVGCEENEIYQLTVDGKIVKLQEAFSDFGQPFERVFKLPVQTFDSFDTLKNVNSVIIAMSGKNVTDTELTYVTDYGARTDPTDLQVVTDASYQQNKIPGTRPQTNARMAVFRRRPMCRRITHFSFLLRNQHVGEDMSIVSARIFYNQQGRTR